MVFQVIEFLFETVVGLIRDGSIFLEDPDAHRLTTGEAFDFHHKSLEQGSHSGVAVGDFQEPVGCGQGLGRLPGIGGLQWYPPYTKLILGIILRKLIFFSKQKIGNNSIN